MLKHLNIKIFGRVQGVFFRVTTQKKAEELGLNGFVKNDLDGSVHIEVEGDEQPLKQFIDWCFNGPKYAEVKNISVEEGAVGQYDHFEIRYN